MATKISSIYTLITADDKPLKRGLVKARGEAVKGAGKIQKALNKINFKAIALGAAAMGASLAYAAKKFIDLAVEQERVEKRLGAVLKSTGNAAGYNLDQMKKMASAMQEVTTTGDETILAGMAILGTFKKIRGDAFERTTMAALDLAEVVGTGLNASMIQLGKALNDPVANLGALSRAGIQFTKDQKRVIKGLWETGKEAEAQSIILDELESQFGGTARAARDTFGGALSSLKNTLGDIGETIGFALMPPIKNMIDRFARWIEINDKLINQDIPGFITTIGNAASTTAKFLYRMNQALDIALGIKPEFSYLEEHLKQLKTTEKKYEDQKKKLESVGWTGGEAYKNIGRQLDLVREKIKLVESEYAKSLKKKFFGEKESGPMDAHVKAYYGSMNKEVDKNIKKLRDAAESEMRKRVIAGMDFGKAYGGDPVSNDVLESNKRVIPVLTDMWATYNNEQVQAAAAMSAEKAETLRLYEEEQKKHSAFMISLSERTAWSIQETFSNVFYDGMKGKLNSFKDYFNAFLDALQRGWADVMGQMATQWIFGQDMKGGGILSQLSSLFGMGGGAGGAGGSTIRGGQGGGYGFQHGGYIGEPVYGRGGTSGKSYEFHPNEFVIPNKSGKGSGDSQPVVYNVYNLSALDTESGLQYLRRIGAVPLLASENLAENGLLRSAIMENV